MDKTLVERLEAIRDVIARKPQDCLGEGRDSHGQVWSIRDEVVDGLSRCIEAAAALRATGDGEWSDETLRKMAAKAGTDDKQAAVAVARVRRRFRGELSEHEAASMALAVSALDNAAPTPATGEGASIPIVAWLGEADGFREVIHADDLYGRTESGELPPNIKWTPLGDCTVIAKAPTPAEPQEVRREFLGKLVRDEWMAWAREQPNPKPSWLVPWNDLPEPEREVDRRIGERVYQVANITHTPAEPLRDAGAAPFGWWATFADGSQEFVRRLPTDPECEDMASEATPLYLHPAPAQVVVVTDEMVARAVAACWPGYGMSREEAMRAALAAAAQETNGE